MQRWWTNYLRLCLPLVHHKRQRARGRHAHLAHADPDQRREQPLVHPEGRGVRKQTRPRNCGRLILELQKLVLSPDREVLRRSVVKTLEQFKRILWETYVLKDAKLEHGHFLTSQIQEMIALAKSPDVTVQQLKQQCKKVVGLKNEATKILELLHQILHRFQIYYDTGTIPTEYRSFNIYNPHPLGNLEFRRRSNAFEIVLPLQYYNDLKREIDRKSFKQYKIISFRHYLDHDQQLLSTNL